MEIAIIVITIVLGLGVLGFVGFLIYKKVSLRDQEAEKKPVHKKPAPVVKEKPAKVELTPEQKEEKKQKEYTSRTKRISELGLKKANDFSVEEDPNGVEVVGIIFNEKSRVYLFNPAGNKLNAGDVVIVLDQSNTKRTVPVVIPNKFVKEDQIVQPFKDILEVVYQTNEKPVAVAAPVEEAQPEPEPQEEEKVEETPVEEPVEEEKAEEEKAEEPQEETKEEETTPKPQPEPEPEPQEEPKEEEPQEEEKTEEIPVEEPAEEKEEKPAPEPEPEPEPEPVAEEAEDDSDDDSDDSDEGDESDGKSEASKDSGNTTVVFDEVSKKYRIIKTKKTYECKLSMLDESVKDYYDQIRNRLLSYDVKYSKTKSAEKFKYNKEVIAILKVAGKQVGLYLALDPKELENSKYKGKDLSEKASYKATPFQYKTKTDRKTKWAIELVDMLAEKKNIGINKNFKEEPFAKTYPQMTDEELIEKGYMTRTETVVDEAPKGFVKYVEEK